MAQGPAKITLVAEGIDRLTAQMEQAHAAAEALKEKLDAVFEARSEVSLRTERD